MKRVLIYPCGTEIGLEVYRSLCYSTHYEVFGGTDSHDHGRFVFRNLIDHLPFINDDSNEEDIKQFENAIKDYDIDFIYPAMDGVISVFAKFRELFKEILILPDTETAEMCRSKKATYEKLKKIVATPAIYKNIKEVQELPVFIKPDQGQGSVGARRINTIEELEEVDFERYVVMENLPGKEYTVDCFTNNGGKLIYAKGRGRKRIKNGISVNAVFDGNPQFQQIAERINEAIKQKGGWFFQLKESKDGSLKLLEVASRIAGTSAISRNIGANLPLMTVDLFNDIMINDVALNDCYIELDRALGNIYKTDIRYSTVYIDYDDTVVKKGIINTNIIKFIYQCVNNGIKIILLSKHAGDLNKELQKYRLNSIFDEVIQINKYEDKKNYVKECDSIFIDDSYGERRSVKMDCKIPVFDTHMIECLLED